MRRVLSLPQCAAVHRLASGVSREPVRCHASPSVSVAALPAGVVVEDVTDPCRLEHAPTTARADDLPAQRSPCRSQTAAIGGFAGASSGRHRLAERLQYVGAQPEQRAFRCRRRAELVCRSEALGQLDEHVSPVGALSGRRAAAKRRLERRLPRAREVFTALASICELLGEHRRWGHAHNADRSAMRARQLQADAQITDERCAARVPAPTAAARLRWLCGSRARRLRPAP